MFYNECKTTKIHQVQQYNAQIMFPYTSKMTAQNTTKHTYNDYRQITQPNNLEYNVLQ